MFFKREANEMAFELSKESEKYGFQVCVCACFCVSTRHIEGQPFCE